MRYGFLSAVLFPAKVLQVILGAAALPMFMLAAGLVIWVYGWNEGPKLPAQFNVGFGH
ncbi:MAG TPA: hypothetical protein VL306_02175 [Methylomirabilota bacterium]|nr:hypothetical protein [Methylomirabilota bacterium]